MIEIKEKKDCCGRHACASICAHHAITMQADAEGFLYPTVNKDACISPICKQKSNLNLKTQYFKIKRALLGLLRR
jgi:MinD superfamily P-loop ATPase